MTVVNNPTVEKFTLIAAIFPVVTNRIRTSFAGAQGAAMGGRPRLFCCPSRKCPSHCRARLVSSDGPLGLYEPSTIAPLSWPQVSRARGRYGFLADTWYIFLTTTVGGHIALW